MATGRQWLKIAHRGASGTYPEHTRPAFLRAIDLGVDMIELDVQLSRDEQLVVFHDHTLERTTSGAGMVRDRSLKELRELDAGCWFAPDFRDERLMTLPEVLKLTAKRTRLNVEIKAPAGDWPVLVPRLLATLDEHAVLERTVVSCFELGALEEVRRKSESAVLGVLWHTPDLAEAWRWCAEVGASSVHPFWMLASSELTEAAHARALRVFVWTVNEETDIRSVVAAGVDGVISDFPERFASFASSIPGRA